MSNTSSQNNIERKDITDLIVKSKSLIRNSLDAMQYFDHMKGNTLLTLREINWNQGNVTGNSNFSKSQSKVESNVYPDEKSIEKGFMLASNHKQKKNCCEEIKNLVTSNYTKKNLTSAKKCQTKKLSLPRN